MTVNNALRVVGDELRLSLNYSRFPRNILLDEKTRVRGDTLRVGRRYVEVGEDRLDFGKEGMSVHAEGSEIVVDNGI